MSPKTRGGWVTSLTLIVWSALVLSIARIAWRPASARPPVPGAGTWDLPQPFDRPNVGSLVPDVTLLNREGWRCSLAEFRGRRMLLCFFRGDTQDAPMVREWERIHRSCPNVVVLGISASGPGGGSEFRRTAHVTFPLLFDPNYHCTRHREPIEYPIAAVVDEEGRVIYASRTPEGLSDVIRNSRATSRGARPR